jgi:hypothetical protein
MTSQVKGLPSFQGMRVKLSGRLLLPGTRQFSSLVTGIPAAAKARVMTSLKLWCLIIVHGARLDTRLCWPIASTWVPHWQGCGTQMGRLTNGDAKPKCNCGSNHLVIQAENTRRQRQPWHKSNLHSVGRKLLRKLPCQRHQTVQSRQWLWSPRPRVDPSMIVVPY